MAILEDYARRLPEPLKEGADQRQSPTSPPAGTPRSERFDELLPPEPSASPAELEAARIAWTQLFTRAARGPLAPAEAHKRLCEIDPAWDQPTATMLTRLLDEASAQLNALSAGDDAAASAPMVREATRAACEVQFRLAQLAAASRIPSMFA